MSDEANNVAVLTEAYRRWHDSRGSSVDHWMSIDEVIYTLQARLFVHGDYRWHLDEEVQRFVTLPLMVPTPAGPYSQYTPGYPGILAFFVALGALPVSGAVLGAVAVASTYMQSAVMSS